MDEIFKEYGEFIKFGKEVILNILKKSDIKLSEIEEEILERKNEKDSIYFELKEEKNKLKEMMTPYIELYKKLNGADICYDGTEEDLNKAKEIIKNLMSVNNIEKDKIVCEIKKREEYRGNSGAEVVKNFLEYQMKELTKSKTVLSQRAVNLLKEEAEIRHELQESIQEEESAKIMEKLLKKEKEIELLSEKILICEERIKEIEEDIQSEWKYQIYGTISKEELRNKI